MHFIIIQLVLLVVLGPHTGAEALLTAKKKKKKPCHPAALCAIWDLSFWDFFAIYFIFHEYLTRTLQGS